ncbi:hypothetical protein DMUE_3450 [Dictyocoela muelleri]|nr:hypothetical protein DMUE_3450 [Dictyocoela muelleri]
MVHLNLVLKIFFSSLHDYGKKNKSMPLVYKIMKNKSKESYLIAFSYLKKYLKTNPNFIIIDFEMAPFSAINQIFVETKIRGCFFHFLQILYRKNQKLRLTSHYMNSSEFRGCFKMILALAIVPINNLKFEIEKLKKIYKLKRKFK